MSKKKIVVIGGGAAGFFGAINAANFNPDAEIIILEKSSTLLGKVKVSGGGRCNVTHSCFDVNKLLNYYPRGKEFLFDVFSLFNPKNTIEWFQERGVKLKTESDGRMFPVTDNSQTIIDCFVQEAQSKNIQILTNHSLVNLEKENEVWKITSNEKTFYADRILVAPGSTMQVWKIFQALGHTLIEPVPSLFTFNIKDPRLDGLPGLSMDPVKTKIIDSEFSSEGPILITHWGLSGPAVLKLSSYGARYLAERNYSFVLEVNWVNLDHKTVVTELKKLRDAEAKKLIGSQNYFNVPKRLWKSICDYLALSDLKWASAGNAQLEKLATELCAAQFEVNGKSTFKDEFVTAGGIDLNEVSAESMESKLLPGIYFAGEFLNIDALTGGFNFQAAWSGSWLAAKNM